MTLVRFACIGRRVRKRLQGFNAKRPAERFSSLPAVELPDWLSVLVLFEDGHLSFVLIDLVEEFSQIGDFFRRNMD